MKRNKRNDQENYISTVEDTKRLISFFPCPQCLEKGLIASVSTKKLFQKKIDVFCPRCGNVHIDYTTESINEQICASMSLCGIRDALMERLWHSLGMTFPSHTGPLREMRVSQGPKIKAMAMESVKKQVCVFTRYQILANFDSHQTCRVVWAPILRKIKFKIFFLGDHAYAFIRYRYGPID